MGLSKTDDVVHDFEFASGSGIPDYNALTDKHLGAHRHFLLGKKRQLKHLQRTGCIDLEPTPKSTSVRATTAPASSTAKPRKKQPPPQSTTNKTRSGGTRHHNHLRKSQAKLNFTVRKPSPFSDLHDPPEMNSPAMALIKKNKQQAMAIQYPTPTSSWTCGKKFSAPALTPPSSLTHPSALATMASTNNDKFQSTKPRASTPLEGLLKSDQTYQTLKDQLSNEHLTLDERRVKLSRQIRLLRKRVRGVNAVHENDVAVHHYEGIMQQRLVKAEEETMKNVTQRLALRQAIDTHRIDLLAIAKARVKLGQEQQAQASLIQRLEDRIHKIKESTAKASRELVELERQNELDRLERQSMLFHSSSGGHSGGSGIGHTPGESSESDTTSSNADSVATNLATLMDAMQRRARVRQDTRGNARRASCQSSLAMAHHSVTNEVTSRNLETSTLRVETLRLRLESIQRATGFGDIKDFTRSFVETEECLLREYQCCQRLREERDEAEAEVEALERASEMQNQSWAESQMSMSSKVRALDLELEETQARVLGCEQLYQERLTQQTKLRAPLIRVYEACKIKGQTQAKASSSSSSSSYSSEATKDNSNTASSYAEEDIDTDASLSGLLGYVQSELAQVNIWMHLNEQTDLTLGPHGPPSTDFRNFPIQPSNIDSAVNSSLDDLSSLKPHLSNTSASVIVSPRQLLSAANELASRPLASS